MKKLLSYIFVMAIMITTFFNGSVAAATESADLSDFVESMELHNITADENGIYHIEPNTDYSMSLSFAETEERQFSNDETLVFQLPDAIRLSQGGVFAINLIDSQGQLKIDGNTFKVVQRDGHRYVEVNFNKSNAADFDRLKAAGNARFQLTFTGRIEKDQIDDQPFDILKKTFQYKLTKPDFKLSKNSLYDKTTQTISYTVTASITGDHTNVVITDTLIGKALTLNQDVVVESNKRGEMPIVPTYGNNTFTLTVPTATNGEVFTVKYTAQVDPDKVTGSGKWDEVRNKATISSIETPEKDAVRDTTLDHHKISKKAAQPVRVSNILFHTTWTAEINKDKVLNEGGATITDTVSNNAADLPGGGKRAYFVGPGVTIEVFKEDGSSQVRNLTWDQLVVERDAANNIVKWAYTTPVSDGRAYYIVTTTTETNIKDAGVDIVVGNKITDGKNEANAWSTIKVGDCGVGCEPDKLDGTKTATSVTKDRVEWKIDLIVASTGYDRFFVDEQVPKLGSYRDKIVENSIVITGLIGDETYEIKTSHDNDDPSKPVKGVYITFYKDAAKQQQGLLPTADGKPRHLIITLTTEVDQQWLDKAHQNNYTNGNQARHTNVVGVSTTTGYLYRTGEAIPKKQSVHKKATGIEFKEIAGKKYPIFKYELTLTGASNGDIINDVFDTHFLKFLQTENFKIVALDQHDKVVEGTDAGDIQVQEDANGVSFIVVKLPTKNNVIQPRYRITYELTVKDEAALDELNAKAYQKEKGYAIENVAKYNGEESENVITEYHNSPVLDKKIIKDPANENGYIAQFEIILNEGAIDLVPHQDTYKVSDQLSDNMRFKPDSVIVEGDYVPDLSFDTATNTVTFNNVPDNKKIVIKYEALVLAAVGEEPVISNKVTMLGFTKTVEKEVSKVAAGSGDASNPNITIRKKDADTLAPLPGIQFQLFEKLADGSLKPIVDKNGNNAVFTTNGQGEAIIEGNQAVLGWVLWKDKEYALKELNTPTGYVVPVTPTLFSLSERPTDQTQYWISGDKLDIYNEREKVDIEAEKVWVGGLGPRPTIYFKVQRSTDGVNYEDVPTREAEIKELTDGVTKIKWEKLYKKDLNNIEYKYRVIEVDQDGNPFVPDKYEKNENGLTVINTSIEKYPVTFSKVAAGQGNELAGAELSIVKADGTLVEKWISDGTAKVVELLEGEYKLVEDQAPLGYQVAAEIEFKVNPDGSVEVKQDGQYILANEAKVTMVDELKPYDVTFSKVAAGQGNELAGAELSIVKVDGTLVEKWISDGTAKVLKLVAGEYTMIESQAPLGYQVASNITFRVNLDGSVDVKEAGKWVLAKQAKITMVDKLIPKPNLPDTGFKNNGLITIGGILLPIAGLYLVIKARKKKED